MSTISVTCLSPQGLHGKMSRNANVFKAGPKQMRYFGISLDFRARKQWNVLESRIVAELLGTAGGLRNVKMTIDERSHCTTFDPGGDSWMQSILLEYELLRELVSTLARSYRRYVLGQREILSAGHTVPAGSSRRWKTSAHDIILHPRSIPTFRVVRGLRHYNIALETNINCDTSVHVK
jgi:hypothetical protein